MQWKKPDRPNLPTGRIGQEGSGKEKEREKEKKKERRAERKGEGE